MTKRFSVVAKRWSELRLVDHHFIGAAPFPDEEVAVQAIVHKLNCDDRFRKRYDGWCFYPIALHAAVLVGEPQSVRAMRGAA